jgi:hypothetical protein
VEYLIGRGFEKGITMRLDVVLKVGGEKGKKIDDKSLFLFPILHSPNSTQHTQLSSVSNFYEE